jgi:hypothetical protein
MGEIKIALRKELKTEGDQLVLEILQCRNITYKFKSPDHLPGTAICTCTLHTNMYTHTRLHTHVNAHSLAHTQTLKWYRYM